MHKLPWQNINNIWWVSIKSFWYLRNIMPLNCQTFISNYTKTYRINLWKIMPVDNYPSYSLKKEAWFILYWVQKLIMKPYHSGRARILFKTQINAIKSQNLRTRLETGRYTHGESIKLTKLQYLSTSLNVKFDVLKVHAIHRCSYLSTTVFHWKTIFMLCYV